MTSAKACFVSSGPGLNIPVCLGQYFIFSQFLRCYIENSDDFLSSNGKSPKILLLPKYDLNSVFVVDRTWNRFKSQSCPSSLPHLATSSLGYTN
jgi:hypothetical protein